MKSADNKGSTSRIDGLNDTIIALCKEKRLTGEEIFVIGAIANDEGAAESFGEVEALEIAIEAIKRSKDADEVFLNVTKDLEVFDNEVDTVIDIQ